MKLFALCFVLLTTTVALGQFTCPCRFPREGSICRAISQNGPGTCTSITTPCNQCICDENGPFTCTVEEDVRLVFNGTGDACSFEAGERVTCPNVTPGIFTTCCNLQGEGSSDNVPCTLANWRTFVAGGDLVALRQTVETNATLDYTAENLVPSSPGFAGVTYDAGWEFQIPAGQPAFFQSYQAFTYSQIINIPQGQRFLSESRRLNDSTETSLPANDQAAFNAIKAITTPLTFTARYTGVTQTSNVPVIVARFSGSACYEYTIVIPT